jgi:hypothetical protein
MNSQATSFAPKGKSARELNKGGINQLLIETIKKLTAFKS